MDDRDLRRYEMVLRVRDYGTEQASSFPATTLGGELFATVSAAAEELAGHIAAHSSGSSSARQGTASKSVAREALREMLEMIRDTARSMSQTMTGLDTKFRIPRNMSDQEMLGTAQAFATDAVPLKQDFLRFAMPADFLDDLDEHIADFESALTRQHAGRGRQVMATASMDDALGRALAAVRQLDAIVRNTFRNDPARLAAWESARHVKREARTKQTPPAAAPPSQT
jgi:uncharacterized protein (DUF924 family)